MATWPASLPQTLLSTLTRKRQAGKVRTPMDVGPPKQRARYTAVTQTYEGSLILTGAQLTTFYTFYNDTLGYGAVSFTWVDPVTDASASLRFAEDEPEDELVYPHENPNKRLYRVKMQIEKLP